MCIGVSMGWTNNMRKEILFLKGCGLCQFKHVWHMHVFLVENWIYPVVVSLQRWHVDFCWKKHGENRGRKSNITFLNINEIKFKGTILTKAWSSLNGRSIKTTPTVSFTLFFLSKNLQVVLALVPLETSASGPSLPPPH